MLAFWIRTSLVAVALAAPVPAWAAAPDDPETTSSIPDETESPLPDTLNAPSATQAKSDHRHAPLAGAGPAKPLAKASVRAILEREALKAGLPADIAEAVVQVESSFNPNLIGTVGEIGLMQVRPSTAAMMGFRGTPDELTQPETNIRYGVTYLAKAWRLTNGDLCRALMKYRAGHGEETMSPLSVRYCERARSHLAALGSPYAGLDAAPPLAVKTSPVASVVPPVAVQPLPAAPKAVYARLRQGSAAASKAYWQAHEARVRALTAKLRAKWHRVASR